MQPYLSLVIPTRNDTYPSNVPEIQNLCLSILQRQLESAKLPSEILIVEYNPDASRPGLQETLRVAPGRYATIKIIVVPAAFHRKFKHSDRRLFHQSCAVNVGLRRARGDFFVYRASDHIYSEELVRFLAARKLAAGNIYRCDRVDIDPAAFEEMQGADSAEAGRICARHALHRSAPVETRPSYHIPALHTNASGDFLLMSRAVWTKLGGLGESRYPVFLDYDSLALHAAHALGNRQVILPDECCVYKLRHTLRTTARLEQVWTPLWQKLDAAWMRKGNETLTNLSRSVFNYPRRRDTTFEGALLDSFERHFLLPAQLWAHGFPIVRQNYGNWGLGGANLPEHTLVRADWDSA